MIWLTPVIEHVIVLMLENHTFDKMLGFLKKGEGLKGDEFNLVDPFASVPGPTFSQSVLCARRDLGRASR
jgi:phospholipase C